MLITHAILAGSNEPVSVRFTPDGITRVTRPDDGDGHGSAAPDDQGGDAVLDAGGGLLLPGLIDAHIHLREASDLDALAAAGVTTAVDLGTHPDALVAELAARGTVSLLSAGSLASAPGSPQRVRMGFPQESEVTDADDAERYLDWRVAAGADVIKMIAEDPRLPAPALSVDTLRALASGARRRGLLSIAHVTTVGAVERALDAGVDVLTHVPVDAVLPAALARRIADAGVAVCPTLVMMRTMIDALAAAGIQRPGPRPNYAICRASVAELVAAGVTIVAGTDANSEPSAPAPVPHGRSLRVELGLLADCGLSRTAVLDAAGSTAARVLRLPDRGVIEAGRRADLVLFAPGDDPFEPDAVPAGVWVGGEPR